MAKTKPNREKFVVKYMIGDIEVKPVKINGSMWWTDAANTIRAKTWTTKRVIKVGGEK